MIIEKNSKWATPLRTPSGLRPTQKKTRGIQLSQNELAYDKLKHLITTLAYKPGDSVNIPQLMHDLSVGRTPISHALHRLSAEGLVHIIPRKGVMVAPLSINDALDLIEVRLVNEQLCLRLAAANINALELRQLELLLADFEKAVHARDMAATIDIDYAFHEQIALASRNSVLSDLLSVLHARSQRFWATSLSLENHLLEVLDEHHAILTALRNGDAEAAAAAVGAHVLSFKRSLLQKR